MNERSFTVRKGFWQTVIIVLVVFIASQINVSIAEDYKIDVNKLAQETQQMSQSTNEMTMVWWIPEEFWRLSFEQDPNVTEAQIEDILKVLRPYMLLVAVDGKIGTFGGVTYSPKESLQNTIKVIDKEGNRISPLSENKIDSDLKNFLQMMKPIFVNMIGPMGQNMHFFVFPAKNKDGHPIAVARKEGAFSVMLGERNFKWRLPLGSLLPPKVCPVDGEKLSGAWHYCPWHGVALK